MFSDLYIKMCLEATEIQNIRNTNQDKQYNINSFNSSDFVFIKFKNYLGEELCDVHRVDHPTIGYFQYIDHVCYWLPTIDQLLKLYQEKHDIPHESWALLWLSNFIEDKVKEDHSFVVTKYGTKEEVGILWIMESCYNKTWSDNQWIPI